MSGCPMASRFLSKVKVLLYIKNKIKRLLNSYAKKILITDGAGFIGSVVIRELIRATDYSVVNIDSLTYAGNGESLSLVGTDITICF